MKNNYFSYLYLLPFLFSLHALGGQKGDGGGLVHTRFVLEARNILEMIKADPQKLQTLNENGVEVQSLEAVILPERIRVSSETPFQDALGNDVDARVFSCGPTASYCIQLSEQKWKSIFNTSQDITILVTKEILRAANYNDGNSAINLAIALFAPSQGQQIEHRIKWNALCDMAIEYPGPNQILLRPKSPFSHPGDFLIETGEGCGGVASILLKATQSGGAYMGTMGAYEWTLFNQGTSWKVTRRSISVGTVKVSTYPVYEVRTSTCLPSPFQNICVGQLASLDYYGMGIPRIVSVNEVYEFRLLGSGSWEAAVLGKAMRFCSEMSLCPDDSSSLRIPVSTKHIEAVTATAGSCNEWVCVGEEVYLQSKISATESFKQTWQVQAITPNGLYANGNFHVRSEVIARTRDLLNIILRIPSKDCVYPNPGGTPKQYNKWKQGADRYLAEIENSELLKCRKETGATCVSLSKPTVEVQRWIVPGREAVCDLKIKILKTNQ